jgi:predicted extracellular nuclease
MQRAASARELELKEAAERRGMQAETLVEIVERKPRPNGRYIVLGDMNDTPTSKPLESFTELVNGLKQVEERGGTPNFGDTPPPNKRWTHRFKESGQPPAYELFDL